MDENIYDILNNSDINLKDYKKEEFNDIEKGKMKKNFRNSIKKKKNCKKSKIAATVAIGLIVGLFGTNPGNQVLASINIIGSDIASRLGIENDLEEYKTVVDKSVTNKGITMQLNEVVLDGNELIVSSTLKSNDKKIDVLGMIASGKVYINGKSVGLAAGGGSKKIDDYTVEQVMTHTLDGSKSSGDLDVKILYTDVRSGDSTIKGTWKFEFKTNGDELVLDTQIIEMDNKFILDNGEVTIKKYTSNSVGQKIYYSKTSKGNAYDIKLVGTDDLGNKVEFYSRNSSEDKGMLTRYDLDGPLSTEAKSLTLTPYAVEFPKESGRMSDDFKQVGESFTIELN